MSKQITKKPSKSRKSSRKSATGAPNRTPKATKSSPAKTQSTSKGESIARWTFLTNHAHVLAVLHSNPHSILRQVAVEVGITERAVQRIVQDLEEGGFILREKVGRSNHYEVLTDQHLRHSVESHRTIGDLLELICK